MSKPLVTQPESVVPSDAYAGAQLRAARLTHGWSQSRLGEAAGVSFQQVQKYESGRNRIAFSTLQKFASALQLPIEHFLEDMPADAGLAAPPRAPYVATRDPRLEALQAAYSQLTEEEREVVCKFAQELLAKRETERKAK